MSNEEFYYILFKKSLPYLFVKCSVKSKLFANIQSGWICLEDGAIGCWPYDGVCVCVCVCVCVYVSVWAEEETGEA